MGNTFVLRRGEGGSAIQGGRTLRAPGVTQALAGSVDCVFSLTGILTVERRPPLLADVTAKAEHVPTFGDATLRFRR